MPLTEHDREHARLLTMNAIEKQRQDVHLCGARDFINSSMFAVKDAIDGAPEHRRARTYAAQTFLRAALHALGEAL